MSARDLRTLCRRSTRRCPARGPAARDAFEDAGEPRPWVPPSGARASVGTPPPSHSRRSRPAATASRTCACSTGSTHRSKCLDWSESSASPRTPHVAGARCRRSRRRRRSRADGRTLPRVVQAQVQSFVPFRGSCVFSMCVGPVCDLCAVGPQCHTRLGVCACGAGAAQSRSAGRKNK